MKVFVNLILLSIIGMAHAIHLGTLIMHCEPYCGNTGRQNGGARGVCANVCFAVNSGYKSNQQTYDSHRGEDRGCSAFVPGGGTHGISPCGSSSTLGYTLSGNTCDEFPFARTTESGGNTNPRNPAILRCVPGAENSSGGAQFNNFLAAHGGVNGDTFDFAFYLPSLPVPFCSPRSQLNDGTEFRYLGGTRNNYQNARRDSMADVFKDVSSRASNTTNPVYQTSGGHAVVTFGEIDIGTQLWDDKYGSQTINGKLSDDYADYILATPTVDSRAAAAC